MTRPIRLTTRSIATATAIRDCVEFTTSGSLRGESNPHLSAWSTGQLSGLDLAWFRHDLAGAWTIDYVVWSYSTPIAWKMADGTWHRVGQTFSSTTAKHQGNLYLISKPDHDTYLVPVKQFGSKDRWNVWCDTCDRAVSAHPLKSEAHRIAHTHRIAGRMGVSPRVSA